MALLDVFSTIDMEPVSASGVWVEARDGQRYLDFYGGHAVALLGHSHPRLVEVLDRQARTLLFQSNIVQLEVRRRAADALASFAPQGLEHVFFVNSGAEANESALRMAFRATGRSRIIAVAGAFHGRSAAASSVTSGSASWYAFPRAPFAVTFVDFNDEPGLEAAMGEDVAAVIVEPVQGMAGARALTAEFLQLARKLTRKLGALLVFDEVQCGMGRTGHPFAAQAFGVTPDVLTTAKGLAGGFPAGAVVVTDAVAAHVRKGDLGTTFGGGPLACALVETVVDVIRSEQLLPRVRRLSQRLRTEARTGPVKGVQGLGFLLGLRVRRPASELLPALRAKGVLAGGSADPHVIRLLPPLVLEDAHVDFLVQALSEL